MQTIVLGLRGLLERLITHFELSSSKEEELCRVWCLLGKDPASWEALSWGKYPLGKSIVSLRDLTDSP